MTLNEANEIKERVREYFKEGHKSSNKFYEEGACKDLAKEKRRNAEEKEAGKAQDNRKDPTDNYNLAEILAKTSPAHRAGNCWETSVLSAYYILNDRLVDRDLIYIATVSPPPIICFAWFRN